MAPPIAPGRARRKSSLRSTLPNFQCRGAGHGGGERLSRVHACARGGRRDAEAQQHRGGNDAVGHADSAIDHLRRKADGDE